MLTRELLSECAKLINRFGPDAREVDQFIAKHAENAEFVKLANLSRTLKRALSPSVPVPVAEREPAANH
jgi:hypothetical protein